jgi:tight adherence protein B
MRLITLIILISVGLLILSVIYKMKKNEALISDRANSLPEVIDLIISGLQAGVSISESLANLGVHGPICVKELFSNFKKNIQEGSSFQNEVETLKQEYKDPLADQLFETLLYSKKFGGRNTIKILHELSEFVAADLGLRAEISARYGWVKNSASLAALAPWLLYLILRTQENARIAYSQPTGQIFMILGFGCTVIAYFWMQKIASLPTPKRIFVSINQSSVEI